MIENSTLDRINDYGTLSDSRQRLRGVYCSEEGIKHLANMCNGANIFSRIEENEPMVLGGRNIIIDLLESMGFLDEDNIERIVRFMFTLPLVSRRPEEEEADGE